MNKDLFISRYKKLNITDDKIVDYLMTILKFEQYILKDIEEATEEDIKDYFDYLIESNENNYNNVIHIARYFYYINNKERYIFMTRYFNAVGVLENILDRISLYESKEKQEEIIRDMKLPPFGIGTEKLPKYTKDFMDKLNKHLPRNTCNKILAGNNHRIPRTGFDKEKEFYEKAESFETYLKERHQRKVAELQYHLDHNLVWFEQVITKEAIDYVKSNQEILSGVIKDDKLYVTKIPYDINNFLNETDDTLKRYYACHCSFVRDNIVKETEDIPKEWCYCSAGFAKYPYEIILGQELDVKLLKTPIDGDYVCRFEIGLDNVNSK